MTFKSKKLLVMGLLAGIMSFATESAFYPYTTSDYNIYHTPYGSQFWDPAQMITLNVSAGSAVYLTNYVSNWYGTVEDLGESSYAAGYNMNDHKYGYVLAQKDDEGKVSPVGGVHWSDGKTKDITYQNPTGPETKTTTGYLLDKFEDDAEIFFVMTPNGYDDTVNSFGPVDDPDGLGYSSIMQSRQINTQDQSGLVRVNFGTVDGVGHEFVIGAVAMPPDGGGEGGGASGQPLPGLLLAGLLSLGTVAAGKKMQKKRS